MPTARAKLWLRGASVRLLFFPWTEAWAPRVVSPLQSHMFMQPRACRWRWSKVSRGSPMVAWQSSEDAGRSLTAQTSEMVKVEDDLRRAAEAIARVEEDIQDVTRAMEGAMRTKDQAALAYLRDKENKLLDEENKLRDKENKLLDEKNKLHDKEMLLLKQSVSIAPERSDKELLDWLIKQQRAKTPQPLTEEGVGREFPLQGRGDVLEQLWRCHVERFNKRMQRGRRAHPIPVYLGQSGIGKSRLLEEHAASLREKAAAVEGHVGDTPFAQALRKASVDLRVTFGNGCGLGGDESPTSAIALRMVHAHFAGAMSLDAFGRSLSPFLGGDDRVAKLTIIRALELIRADVVASGQIKDTDDLIIVLGVDEVDKVLVDSASTAKQRRAFLSPLLRALGSSLCDVNLVGPVTFLCPLVAGVMVSDVREVIAQSSYLTESLVPTPLSQSHVMNLLASRQWAPALLESPELRHCVADLGGVPLVVEAFVKALEARHRGFRQEAAPFSVIRGAREDTRAFMVNKILQTLRSEASSLVELLFAVLWNRRVMKLSTRFEDVTVEDLQATGLLSLDENSKRLRIPLIYLELIAGAGIEELTIPADGRMLCQAALQVLAYEDPTWGGFERFNQEYFALRLALARYVGHYESISLSELHEGAWVGEPVGQLGVLLNASSSCLGATSHLLQRHPREDGHSDEGLKRGVVYRNAAGAPFDLVTSLALAGEDEGSCLTMLHECKHTAQTGTKGPSLDAKLVEAALKKAQDKYGDASNTRSHKFAVMVMSNRLATGSAKLIKQMCERAPLAVVAGDNAVEYFGPSLADRFLGYVKPPQRGL